MPPNAKRVLVPDISHLRFPEEAERNYPIRFLFGKTMGTTWRCNVVVPHTIQEEFIQKLILDSLQLVIDQMSHWEPSSCLSRFNNAPHGTWFELPMELFQVLETSIQLARKTDGAYDPTIGEMVNHLGFGPEVPIVCRTNPNDLNAIKARCGWDKLILDVETHRAMQPGQLKLDLSSIAKGYAVDLVAERLLVHGVTHFLFEVGGEFRGEGCKPNGSPWWVELENGGQGDDQGNLPINPPVVALCGLSVASSGHQFHQSLLPNGEAISHLINAKTFSASLHEIACVTVFTRSCMLADGWATALYVSGLDQGLRLANQYRIAAIFFTNEGLVLESDCIGTFFDS